MSGCVELFFVKGRATGFNFKNGQRPLCNMFQSVPSCAVRECRCFIFLILSSHLQQREKRLGKIKHRLHKYHYFGCLHARKVL